MKGIANRQNTLLGRKPVMFGGGRPSPADRSARYACRVYRQRTRTTVFQKVVFEPGPTSMSETNLVSASAVMNTSQVAVQEDSGVIHEKPEAEEVES